MDSINEQSFKARVKLFTDKLNCEKGHEKGFPNEQNLFELMNFDGKNGIDDKDFDVLKGLIGDKPRTIKINGKEYNIFTKENMDVAEGTNKNDIGIFNNCKTVKSKGGSDCIVALNCDNVRDGLGKDKVYINNTNSDKTTINHINRRDEAISVNNSPAKTEETKPAEKQKEKQPQNEEKAAPQEQKQTDYIVQIGDTVEKIIARKYAAEGKNVDKKSDEFKKAVEEFKVANKDMFRNDKFWLRAGDTVKLAGDISQDVLKKNGMKDKAEVYKEWTERNKKPEVKLAGTSEQQTPASSTPATGAGTRNETGNPAPTSAPDAQQQESGQPTPAVSSEYAKYTDKQINDRIVEIQNYRASHAGPYDKLNAELAELKKVKNDRLAELQKVKNDRLAESKTAETKTNFENLLENKITKAKEGGTDKAEVDRLTVLKSSNDPKERGKFIKEEIDKLNNTLDWRNRIIFRNYKKEENELAILKDYEKLIKNS